MTNIKDAADSLLSKGEITQEQYNSIEKTGAFGITKEAAVSNPGLFKKVMTTLLGVGGGKKGTFNSDMARYGVVGAAAKKIWPIAATGAAVGATKELVVDPMIESRKINKSFETMQSKVPQLAEANQEDLRDYFNVVKTFSPKAASNPLVAGSLVNKMREFGGVDHKLVQDITAIQTGLARPSIVESLTTATAKAVSSIPG